MDNVIDQSFLPEKAELSISDNDLDRGLHSTGISKGGSEWLTYSTNLFPDDLVAKARQPDGGPGATCLYEFPDYIEISKPESIAADAKWGFHIVQTPFTETIDFSAGVIQGNRIATSAPGSTAHIGGIYIQFYVADGDTFDVIPGGDMQITRVAPLGQASCLRLCSQAFEVVSTAPPLVEQGDCLAYRTPVAANEDSRYFGTPESAVRAPCRVLRMPPRNRAEAIRMTGSKYWKAKEGLLSQGWMEHVVDEVDLPNCLPVVLIPNTHENGETAWYARLGISDSYQPTQVLNGMYNGAFFSNLNKDSTFTVTVKWAYEIFPGVNDEPYINNVSLRPDADWRALAVYLDAARHAPFGVPVRMNASGDFWRGIKDLLWDAADTVASMDVPIISTVAKVAKGARSVYKAVTNGSKAKAKSTSSTPVNKSGGGTTSQLMRNPQSQQQKKAKKTQPTKGKG